MFMLLVIGSEGVPLIVPSAPQLKLIDPEVVDHSVPVNVSYASCAYMFLANVNVNVRCRRPSVCLSVVCNVRAPSYSGD